MIGLKRGTVRLLPYQPAWKGLFEAEASKLRTALGNQLTGIEHVGSTAIEGMDAKPIIDIIATVENLDKARELLPLVEALGYRHKEEDDVPERVFFTKGPPGKRTHHLSLTEPASRYCRAHILFRDYLRTHKDVAEEYRELKRGLAQRYPDDRASYTAGKQAFVDAVLELATAEA